jgi:molybdopterin molybdotransferase
MPSFDDARRIILEHVAPRPAEQVPLAGAVGRVLADDVTMPFDMPGWDNSAMDGFAVRAADCTGPARLSVVGYIPAGGLPGGAVGPGQAIRIMTGAPLPPGADAIAPLEDVEEEGDAIRLRRAVRPGAHVRRRGEDLRAGEVALPAGTLVGPGEVSLLASAAPLGVPVVRRVRVAILSTGDELVEPGQPVGPGQICDSNGAALAAAVALAGGEPVPLGIARDDRAALRAKLERGLEADALVTSAGVSAGDRDLVRAVLDELGVRQLFWKVDVKPGRPTAFGVCGATPVFSLPGNPVSTLLMFEQFVRPALLRMMGHRQVFRPLHRALLQERLAKSPGRVGLVRVRLTRREDGTLLASTAGDQATGILRTLLRADGVAVLPAEQGPLEAGQPVLVQRLRDDLDPAVGA